ncbi:anti-phage protein KwaA [Pontibacter qinzhouensis]|nr:anti-phage protein KwaA [Pontibacter qinzhouensis]
MRQKFEFYILSLFLLFLLLFINKVPFHFGADYEIVNWKILFTNYPLVVISLICMTLGFIFYYRFNYKFEKGATLLPVTVTHVENINYESVTFLATYIVPLACIDLDKDRSSLMLVTIIILIGWIYIKTNLFYTNPTLAIWGYHIYKVSTSNRTDITIIVRGKVAVGSSILLKNIDDKIYLAKL